MAEKVKEMNLVQKLAKVRKIAEAVIKDKQGFNYSYADIEQISAKVTAGMDKYHISLIPNIVPGTTEIMQVTNVNTKFDKQGKPYDKTETEMLIKSDMIFIWINDDNPDEKIEVTWALTGAQSDPSQAFGSGLTYCTRYFLTNYFQTVQTENSVEEYRKKQKEAEQEEDKIAAKGIIEEVDRLTKQYVGEYPDKKDDVTKFMGKYIKGSNYNKITDPAIAAKLLSDFKDTYINA